MLYVKLLQLLPENLMPDTTFILGVLAKDLRAGRGCPRSCRRPRHLCTPRLGSMTPCGNTCQSMCDALLHAAGGAARRPPTCVCNQFGSYVKPCRPCYGISRSLLIDEWPPTRPAEDNGHLLQKGRHDWAQATKNTNILCYVLVTGTKGHLVVTEIQVGTRTF